ncbi:unnamed protein product [Trifolium pratense]|uniref:Uncharacterized protein n=1 Tax=Trifolium pratense TaxID=57577 RepID=A0ACB0LXS7_TRIPR|nr:unnamed protein product [Trifolium pratense]
MQREKNMVKILMFFCIMILFLSIFIVATDIEEDFLKCDTYSDCPSQMCYSFLNFIVKCINNRCDCVREKDLGP